MRTPIVKPHRPGAAAPALVRLATPVLTYFLAFVLTVVLALVVAVPAFAQNEAEESAKLRIAHLSPDAPAVDVYLDGQLIREFAGLPFKSVSPYQDFPAGEREVEVYVSGEAPDGSSEPILKANVVLEKGTPKTLAVLGLAQDESLELKAYKDSHAEPGPGTGMLRVIHAKPDEGAVRVDLKPKDSEGDLKFVVPGFSYATDYVEVPADYYEPKVEVAGAREEVELEVPNVPVLPGKAYTAFSVGRVVNETQEVILTVDTASGGTDNPEEFLPDTGGATVPQLLLKYRVTPLLPMPLSNR